MEVREMIKSGKSKKKKEKTCRIANCKRTASYIITLLRGTEVLVCENHTLWYTQVCSKYKKIKGEK